MPPGAARCPLFDHDDRYRQKTLDEHRSDLERRAGEAPEEHASAEIALVQPIAWADLPETIARGEVRGFTLAYHPLTGGMTMYTSITVEEGQSLDRAQQRMDASMISDLNSDREEASPSEKEQIDSVVARVQARERPAIAVALVAPLEELAELRDHDAVYDIALDGQALKPFDPSSLENRRSACDEAAREGSETEGDVGD